jgi:PAS domain-containing protein
LQWNEFIVQYRLPIFGMTTHPYYTAQLLYFFTTMADEDRLHPMLMSVNGEAGRDAESLRDFSNGMMIGFSILQVIVLGILIAHLFDMSRRMHRVLNLFLFLDPSTVMQNMNVMSLLVAGEVLKREEGASFEHAQQIVRDVREGVLITDRELVIRDFNDACLKLLEVDRPSLSGRLLNDVLVGPADAPAIRHVIGAIHDVFQGIEPLPLEDVFAIAVGEKMKYVAVRIIYLTDNGLFTKRDGPASIRGIVIQMKDLTERRRREDAVEQEVLKVKAMLECVMPAPVVKQLADGAENISFAVQSASIGCVKVMTNSGDPTMDNPFGGADKLFVLFDEWMTPFTQLSRVSVLSNEYIFAGGVFTMANKPEKHAEEATRFALKIISSRSEVEAAVGPGVTLLVGLNTGGPLVGGVMCVERPIFLLFGTALETAKALAETGVADQLHVTRSVYELVYSHNFRVTERGDIKLRHGGSVHTYVITP